MAVAAAVSMFIEGQVDRIVLSRPAVEAGERLGFLPGDMKDKIDPYMQPLYDALNDFLPSNQLGKLIEEKKIPIDFSYPKLFPEYLSQKLSNEQLAVVKQLKTSLVAKVYSTTLLKGVTGSGKTEVYLELVAEALRLGRQVLVLLPEIALTSAFIEKVKTRFGNSPAEWHSGVAKSEKYRCRRMIASGDVQLVVGARSALYLPFKKLGLIVVDEEHDSSYKQEDGILYNARDMAVLRASLKEAMVVLASATPSLETSVNAKVG